jgi:hypothetical protein
VIVAVDVDGGGQAVAGQGDAQGGRLTGVGRGAFVGQSDCLLAVHVGERAAGQGAAGDGYHQGHDQQSAKDDEGDAGGAVHTVFSSICCALTEKATTDYTDFTD